MAKQQEQIYDVVEEATTKPVKKEKFNWDKLKSNVERERIKELKKTKQGRLELYGEKLTEKKTKKEYKREFQRPERIKKKIEKWMRSKVISRPVFRKTTRPTLQIRSFEPEPYRSVYFKSTYEQERKNLFFK